MSWLDDITSGDSWRESPGTTAGKAAVCIAMPWLCLGQAVSERGRAAAAEAAEILREGAASTISAGGEAVSEVLRESAAPLERMASIAQWVAIGLYAIAIVVVALVIWWVMK